MKIRKYSIAWWVTRKPVKAVLFSAFCILFMSALFKCHDVGLKKIEPISEAYAETKQVIEIEKKQAEIEENEPYWTTYDIPLSDELQDYTMAVCETYGVDVELVFGIMAVESNYNIKAKGDGGNSLGLMQIQPRWNKARMKRLGVTDLLDPHQNILCGVDILAELLEKYDTEKALVCYNMGESGAKGKTSTSYSRKVLEKAGELL